MSDEGHGDPPEVEDEATRAAAIAAARDSIDRLGRGDPPASPALERLGDAVRRLSRWMVVERDAVQIERAALALETLIDELGAREAEPISRLPEPDPERGGLLANARGTHPLLGSASPVAPPIRLRVGGDRVVGDVRFDVRFEGNRGWVHGGFVAAGFDIVLVQGAKLSGRAGPTGTLSVRFLAPTPIDVDLRYEAGVERTEGRKLFAQGTLRRRDDGTITARAEAVVIAPG
jgi:acyl-coenzyme A thioesterase PaaI-like protein